MGSSIHRPDGTVSNILNQVTIDENGQRRPTHERLVKV